MPPPLRRQTMSARRRQRAAAATAPTPVAAVADCAPPPGSQPAVPAERLRFPARSRWSHRDAALGFKPSTAPPLDPSISQFVAQPIIARYQQTASNAGVATGPIAPLNGGSPAAVRRTHAAADAAGAVRRP